MIFRAAQGVQTCDAKTPSRWNKFRWDAFLSGDGLYLGAAQ
jgi:hypothetical protein